MASAISPSTEEVGSVSTDPARPSLQLTMSRATPMH